MIYEFNNYRAYLRSTFADRALKNPSYSLRGFAKHVGLNHATLSLVLKGDRNLSLDRAQNVAQKLGLQSSELEYFTDLVQFESTKNPEVRSMLQEKLNRFSTRTKSYDLSVDHFKMISDWYHFPIMQLLNLDNFKFSPRNIAEKLGISPTEAEAAVERLLRLELIEQKAPGAFVRTNNRLLVSSKAPNEAIRKFHEQMLTKALESLENQTTKDRINGSETFAFSKENLEEANKIIEKFYDRMIELSDRTKSKTDVYHLCVNFFNLTMQKRK